MNDVLPKPFTKEGLLLMLEKHLAHLKKPNSMPGAMAPHPDMSHMPAPPVQPLSLNPHSSANPSIKDSDNSPSKSPATGTTASNWSSPNQIPGVSPAGSAMTDEYMGGPTLAQPHPGAVMANAGPPFGMAAGMPTTPGIPPHGATLGYAPVSQPRPVQTHMGLGAQHRRQISDISGGAEDSAAKRQQMYAPQALQTLGPIRR